MTTPQRFQFSMMILPFLFPFPSDNTGQSMDLRNWITQYNQATGPQNPWTGRG